MSEAEFYALHGAAWFKGNPSIWGSLNQTILCAKFDTELPAHRSGVVAFWEAMFAGPGEIGLEHFKGLWRDMYDPNGQLPLNRFELPGSRVFSSWQGVENQSVAVFIAHYHPARRRVDTVIQALYCHFLSVPRQYSCITHASFSITLVKWSTLWIRGSLHLMLG